MSKSKFWTRAQVERLRALYHLHTNKEIAEMMGITNAAVSLMACRLRLKKVKGKGVHVSLTTEQIEWLCANYANTTNAEIMEHLDIKNSTLHRLARAYRLTKSKEFMADWQKKITEIARLTNQRNNWPPKATSYQIAVNIASRKVLLRLCVLVRKENLLEYARVVKHEKQPSRQSAVEYYSVLSNARR